MLGSTSGAALFIVRAKFVEWKRNAILEGRTAGANVAALPMRGGTLVSGEEYAKLRRTPADATPSEDHDTKAEKSAGDPLGWLPDWLPISRVRDGDDQHPK